MNAMVSVEGLQKSFGPRQVVRGLSFEVGVGEVLGFLGPNGAGKSTTMKMITGFLQPDAGRVTIAAHDVASDPVAAKRRIGYLPEGAPLYGDMTTRAFLGFVARMRGFAGAETGRRVERVAGLVNLEGVMDQQVDTLSKGFKRRVGIAQAILHDPPVLVLDEPTDGLDPNQKHEVRALIRAMARDKAIILSTHILEEVGAVCSRALIVAGGEIVADDTPEGLARRGEGAEWLVSTAAGVDPAAVASRLNAIAGIDAIEAPTPEGGEWRVRLGRASAADLRHAFDELPWEVEIHRRRGSLDDVFREITGAGRQLS